MNIFENTSMSDLSFTQTDSYMRSRPIEQRVDYKYKPIWQLAAENNAKPVVITDRANGVKVKTTTGYRK